MFDGREAWYRHGSPRLSSETFPLSFPIEIYEGNMKRRTAVRNGVCSSLLAGSMLAARSQAQDSDQPEVEDVAVQVKAPIFVATWNFGKAACERSREVLTSGGSVADAVERGINVTELDESNSTVGVGGAPNANGVVQLDACFMKGERQQAGSVAAIEGYPNPVSVARRVMETTKHVMLAGADAASFAKQQGFPAKDLLTEKARKNWLKWKAEQKQGTIPAGSHDTIALLGLDAKGNLAGGCSTSGLAYKLPGRVGDSPLIGSGLYVDGQVGAAGATGVGENVLRYCATFLIVEFMRQGKSPTDACEAAIRRVAEGDQKDPSELSINFVALNKAGVIGAAGTDAGFRMAVVDGSSSTIVKPRQVL